VRKGHPAAARKLSQREYDAFYHVVLHTADEHGLHMKRDLLDRGQAGRIAARAAHLYALPLISRQTDLVCGVPRILADFYTRKYELVELDAPVGDIGFPVMMIWHQSQNADPGHAWLRNRIVEACKAL